MKPVVIVSALRDEINDLRLRMGIEKTYRKDQAHFFEGKLEGRPLIVGFTGIGAKATFAGLQMLRELVDIGTVVGTGYTGGLVESLETGSLVMANEICRVADGKVEASWEGTPSLLSLCRRTLSEDKSFSEGRLVSLKNALTDPEQKHAAANDFKAIAVDMESAALAAFCVDRGVPFMVLRAVLDPVSLKVPDPGEFLDRERRISKRRVVRYVAKNPQAIWELPRLGSQAKQARHRIAEVMPKIVTAILSS